MIVWLASIPGSGNTFFRILVKSLYHLPTYTDGFKCNGALPFDRNNREFDGYSELPVRLPHFFEKVDEASIKADLDKLEREDEIYFIKTHQIDSSMINNVYRAVVLVRDPRDTIIMSAFYLTKIAYTWSQFRYFLKKYKTAFPNMAFINSLVLSFLLSFVISLFILLKLEKIVYFTFFKLLVIGKILNWENYYSSWLKRSKKNTVFVRYEDLIDNPVSVMVHTFATLGFDAEINSSEIPSFEGLKTQYPRYFKKAEPNRWKNYFSKKEMDKISQRCGDIMNIFGYQMI